MKMNFSTISERLADHFSSKYDNVLLRHRELSGRR